MGFFPLALSIFCLESRSLFVDLTYGNAYPLIMDLCISSLSPSHVSSRRLSPNSRGRLMMIMSLTRKRVKRMNVRSLPRRGRNMSLLRILRSMDLQPQGTRGGLHDSRERYTHVSLDHKHNSPTLLLFILWMQYALLIMPTNDILNLRRYLQINKLVQLWLVP